MTLADLRDRGFVVALSQASPGAVLIAPADRLTVADRDFVRTHKADLAAAIAGESTVAIGLLVTADNWFTNFASSVAIALPLMPSLTLAPSVLSAVDAVMSAIAFGDLPTVRFAVAEFRFAVRQVIHEELVKAKAKNARAKVPAKVPAKSPTKAPRCASSGPRPRGEPGTTHKDARGRVT